MVENDKVANLLPKVGCRKTPVNPVAGSNQGQVGYRRPFAPKRRPPYATFRQNTAGLEIKN
ncbi:MAG: hypothetical protein LBT05_14450 [Planctomycetaceae bacterium]|jgi:hypothetical protein|nr:hypothetical protein [Planctomycetaceae bacterium]